MHRTLDHPLRIGLYSARLYGDNRQTPAPLEKPGQITARRSRADKRLYLFLIPQALIPSMLEPEAFGSDYSVGSKVHARGEAIFFEVDPTFRSDDFPFHLIDERFMTQPDGAPNAPSICGFIAFVAHPRVRAR